MGGVQATPMVLRSAAHCMLARLGKIANLLQVGSPAPFANRSRDLAGHVIIERKIGTLMMNGYKSKSADFRAPMAVTWQAQGFKVGLAIVLEPKGPTSESFCSGSMLRLQLERA